jgi:hypothetical protein
MKIIFFFFKIRSFHNAGHVKYIREYLSEEIIEKDGTKLPYQVYAVIQHYNHDQLA